MKELKVRYLKELETGTPKRMSLTIASRVRITDGESRNKRAHARGMKACASDSIVWSGRRQIMDACKMLEETGKQVWYCTMTYSAEESRARVVVGDIERMRDWVERVLKARFVGVMELSEQGSLHVHCLIAGASMDSDPDFSSVWGKGFVHSRLRYYNAEKAGGYLSKQYSNGEKYEVEYRGRKRAVVGMEGFRALWPRLPFVVLDKVTKGRVGSYERGARYVESPSVVRDVITKKQVKAGEGELFAVVKADLLCVDKDTLAGMTVKEFRRRLDSIHITRGVNGTLYATNNARVPSALMRWMIKNKKEVLIDTFKRARAQILLEGACAANDAN